MSTSTATPRSSTPAPRPRPPKPRRLSLYDLDMSPHARQRARELGYTADEIAECVRRPEQSYPSHVSYGPDRRINQRGDLALALHQVTGTVITVLLRTEVRWEHGRDRRPATVALPTTTTTATATATTAGATSRSEGASR